MLQKCSLWRVAELFFLQPTTPHTLKDISTHAKLAHTAVKQHLIVLEKEKLIRVEKKKQGQRIFPQYAANNETPEFRRLKQLHNLDALHRSKVITYLYETYAPKAIILFGSFAKGEDTEHSDIDIFVETTQKTEDLSRFEKKLQKKIQIHYKESFSQYPRELKNNILNGIVLAGYLKGYA